MSQATPFGFSPSAKLSPCSNKIDLFSISDAMLLGGQTRQKLQWIYGKSSMPNKLTVVVFLRIYEFKPNVKNIDLLWGEELHF